MLKIIKSTFYLSILLAIFVIIFACNSNVGNSESVGSSDVEIIDSDSENTFYEEFELFLKTFLDDCFINHALDIYLFKESDTVTKYLNPEIGFYRFSTPGSMCLPTGYTEWEIETFYSDKIYPEIPIVFYRGEFPDKGFCEPSDSPEGIYYKTIAEYPVYPTFNEDSIVLTQLDIPDKYLTEPKIIQVKILYQKAVIKDFIFAFVDSSWCLVVVNDCDCSA